MQHSNRLLDLSSGKTVKAFKWVLVDGDFDPGRNYRLFSILADVRNGFGFAGCDTGDKLKPIAMPRGLPDDVSSEVKEITNSWDMDGHSHSWFTLAEILAYDWDQVATIRGEVKAFNFYKDIMHGNSPSSWCNRSTYPKCSHTEMLHKIQEIIDRCSTEDEIKAALVNIKEQVPMQWTQTYRQCCEYFLQTIVPRLRDLADILPVINHGGSKVTSIHSVASLGISVFPFIQSLSCMN